ncbi:hypothetical protein MKC63_12195 [[Clostridium] innocuum]|nr:hypothetical protein [[Clostridium] innocuum]
MFSGMLDDIHISDALGTEDSIMLKIMIGCLTDEFILETDNSGYLTQFARYTRLGRQLYGRKQNILTEYTEKKLARFFGIMGIYAGWISENDRCGSDRKMEFRGILV